MKTIDEYKKDIVSGKLTRAVLNDMRKDLGEDDYGCLRVFINDTQHQMALDMAQQNKKQIEELSRLVHKLETNHLVHITDDVASLQKELGEIKKTLREGIYGKDKQ